MKSRPQGMSTRRRIANTQRPARGFTLVELLIAMALTLMLVYAIAKFYSYVGETVRDGRAQIEMGNSLRAAALRLEQDFAEMTVRVGGRVDAGQAQGHFELIEGIASDIDPNGDQLVNASGFSNDLLDTNGNLLDPNSDGKPDGQMLGDMDDILSMTIRSQGDPFVGRWWNPAQSTYQIVQSNLAEVIWFTTFKDVNNDGAWQQIEPRYLVRRLLLIRPDLAVSWPNAPAALPQGQSIFHHNDISCHVLVNGGNFAGYATNSLSDLSQRENRCIHQNLSNLTLNGLFVAGQGNMPNSLQLYVGLTDVPATPLFQQGSCSLYSLSGFQQTIGEDQMLSNLMAFDVRVYDPYANLWPDNIDLNGGNANPDDDAHGVLAPGDAGYAAAVIRASQNNIGSVGNGAYVDLWYTRGFANLPAAMKLTVLRNSNSAYSWAPQARNFPGINIAVWDTWTTAYEKDGIQQVPPPYGARVIVNGIPAEDWMVNGVDDPPYAGGVDDPGEAETTPPYPVYIANNGQDDDGQNGADDTGERDTTVYYQPVTTMLRGIEVRIRLYEPGTRQTRQLTVATDFIPE